MVDTYVDARVNRDRDIEISAGDIALTQGRYENIAQSVALLAGDRLRELIGGPMTGATSEDIVSEITDALSSDPQIESVRSVDIQEINRQDNSITVRVVLKNNTNFEIPIEL